MKYRPPIAVRLPGETQQAFVKRKALQTLRRMKDLGRIEEVKQIKAYIAQLRRAAKEPCPREHVEYKSWSRSDNRFFGDENNG